MNDKNLKIKLKQIENNMKHKFSIVSIVLIASVYIFNIFNTKKYDKPQEIITFDILSYYAYLPATFIEKDYKLRAWENEEPWISRYWPKDLPNGNFVIKTSMGLSFLYAPFFFTAHALAPALGYETNGFTTPYALALILSSIFYMILGMFALRKVLLKHFNDIITGITLLIIGLSTNLFWYCTTEAPMAHSYGFALFCFFIFFCIKWYENQNLKNSIFLGLLIGIISLIRPSNIIIILFFIFYKIIKFNDLKERFLLFLHHYKMIIVMIISILIVWIPQFLYWKSVTGQYLYYSYGNQERFFFSNPKIFEVLFGFRKGWLTYSPSMIFSIVGIFILIKKYKEYFLPTLIFLIFNIYIISSWWCWWYGGGFGMRPCIESYAILAIPLASYLSWIITQKKALKILLISITTLITLQSAFHIIQYHYKTIHYEAMTSKAYFNSFWRVHKTKQFDTYLDYPNYSEALKGKR